MANRILRDTTDSESINELSWQAEVFFYRLMMKADDYGCFHGNIKLVKAALFPLRMDSVRDADIVRWITECEKSGVVAIYGVENKSYLRIKNFNQRLRTMKSKFPLPVDGNPRSIVSNPRSIDRNPPPEEKGNEEKQKIEVEGENLDKAEEILKSTIWQEDVARKLRLQVSFVNDKLVYFLTKQSLKPDYFKTRTMNDVKDHFVNWIVKLEPDKQQPIKKRHQL